jgi:hypothetical protein
MLHFLPLSVTGTEVLHIFLNPVLLKCDRFACGLDARCGTGRRLDGVSDADHVIVANRQALVDAGLDSLEGGQALSKAHWWSATAVA